MNSKQRKLKNIQAKNTQTKWRNATLWEIRNSGVKISDEEFDKLDKEVYTALLNDVRMKILTDKCNGGNSVPAGKFTANIFGNGLR